MRAVKAVKRTAGAVAFIAAAAIVALAAFAGRSDAVVFGSEVADAGTSAPWVASIWYSEDAHGVPEFICSGSLIASDIVLTAAHCTYDKGFYWVRLKSDTLESDEPLRKVSGVWRHARYSTKTGQNDLGLLRLRTPVEDVKPMVLPTSAEIAKVTASKTFRILGWGEDQDSNVAKFLRAATLDNQDLAASKVYGRLFNKATMLASGKYIKSERLYAGGCHGDSGGPLTTKIGSKTVLAGLTSWGSASGCDRGKPTIFTRVSYYLADIKAGTALVRRSVYGRLIPEAVQSPVIQGDARVGATLVCDKGQWSEETDSTSLQWTSPSRISGQSSPNILVTQADAGQFFECEVTGINKNGEEKARATKLIPRAPLIATKPTISGITSGDIPKLGQAISCAGTKWADAVEAEKKSWFIADINYDGTPRNEVAIKDELGAAAVGTLVTLDKETILAAQSKGIFCRAQALNAGGISSVWVYVSVPRISMPSPYVTLVGYDGSIAPAIGTTLTCKLDRPEQYTNVKYEWSIRQDRSKTAAAVLGFSPTLTFTRELVLAAKEKYLACDVSAENIVGTGATTNFVYVRAPIKPTSIAPDISGVDASGNATTFNANTPLAKCTFRDLVKDETAMVTWYSGKAGNLSTINTILGMGPVLQMTPSIIDEIVGGSIICKVVVSNIAGDVEGTDYVGIDMPEVVYFSQTGHYYKFVSSRISWLDARAAAMATEFNGLKGYLATATTKSEENLIKRKAGGNQIWLGASDAESEGCWKWTDGPEANQNFFAAPSAVNCVINASVGNSNWGASEPNNTNGNENVAQVYSDGTWNDVAGNSSFAYVIEYGGVVTPLSYSPDANASAKISIVTPVDTPTVRGTFTISGLATAERYGNSSIVKVGVRIVNSAGISIAPYYGGGRLCPTGSYSCYYNGYYTSELTFGTLGTADYVWTPPSGVVSFALDTTAWANDTYTVTLFAKDSSGRMGISDSRRLVTANIAPNTSITTPAASATVSGVVNVVGSASADSSGSATINKVGVRITGGAGFTAGYYGGGRLCPSGASGCYYNGYYTSELAFGSLGTADYVWTPPSASVITFPVDTTGWASGTYTITFFTRDSSGRMAVSTPVSFTTSNAAPSAAITSPAAGAVVKGVGTFTGTVLPANTGTATINKVGVRITGGAGFGASSYGGGRICPTGASGCYYNGYYTSELAFDVAGTADYVWTPPAGVVSFNIDTTAFANGTYTMLLFTRDTSGRVAVSAPSTFVITPTVSNVVATSIAGSATSMTVTWTAPLNMTGVSDYQVESATAAGEWKIFAHPASTSAAITVTGLSELTTYQFRVTPIFSGSVNTIGAATSPLASTPAPLVLTLASITSTSNWLLAGESSTASTWQPTVVANKLRITSSTGGRGGAINKTAFDTTKGLDVQFRFNFNTGSSIPGDGFTFFLANPANTDLASAPATRGTWLGGGGGYLAYNGDGAAGQVKGALLGVGVVLNGSPQVRIYGASGANGVLPTLSAVSITNPYNANYYMRVVIDPSTVSAATRGYRVYISATSTFSTTPTASGLLSAIGLSDLSSGVYFGFTGATGANTVNTDIDAINVYGVLKS
ncbi:MAG: trypsin-like serine protease [Actinomycetes bacterium]